MGLSYKATAGQVHKYPVELGLYAAPQFAGVDGQTAASVSALMHATLLQAFGLGVGVRFWENGTGIVGANKSRVFFTLGYGLTNERQ